SRPGSAALPRPVAADCPALSRLYIQGSLSPFRRSARADPSKSKTAAAGHRKQHQDPMVFSGRPSTACHGCRARRLKCDRVQTGCAQCLRKGIQCPGYRDPSAMRLRDETDRVARKAARALKPTTCLARQTADLVALSYHQQRQHIHPLPQAACDVAIAYFMASYIVSSPFEGYLPVLYSANASADDALSSAISAASLATLALRVGSATYMDVALRQYALALRQTNSCLTVPARAVLDRTLAAVLVLGLFEAVVFRGGQAPTSWTAHTFGAMELLQLRGPRQFKSKVSQQLFSQASNNIRASCIQRSVAVPAGFLAFNDQVQPSLDHKDLTVRLAPIVNKVAALKAQSLRAPDPNLLHEALHLDHQILFFTDGLEKELLYTVQQDAGKAPWPSRNIPVCQYPSLRIAKLWNAIHMLRAFLVSFIWHGTSGGMDLANLRTPDTAACKSDYVATLNEYATRNMAEIATRVLASVPAFMETGELEGRFSPPARTLIWPLSILQKSAICPQEVRETSLACLDKLSADLNMPQAVHVARDPECAEDWLHLCHLA
ncbi:hypothetical protein TOPH_06252, partial [Tolypocladium ophioglossoides CBS 100239]